MHIPALEEDTEAATEGKAVGAGGFDGEGVYSGKNDVSNRILPFVRDCQAWAVADLISLRSCSAAGNSS
jgi:hypothetical protein